MAKTEVVKNQLQVIIDEGHLEGTKAKYILDNFTSYFQMADEWTEKAKMLKVTNASQVTEMKMAREGRIFLRDKRVDVEKARKRLKEEALREGQVIDGIAKTLTGLIKPIEDFLDRQEHFVEIQEEAKREVIRLEVEKRIEDERIAKEKADAEALEKARLENEKLKAEAIEREKKAQAERKKQEAILAKERAKAQAEREEQEKKMAEERKKAEAEKKAIEIEREKQGKKFAEAREKAEKEKWLAAEKAQAEKEKARAKLDAERKEKERLEEMLKNQITCPSCGHKFQLTKGDENG